MEQFSMLPNTGATGLIPIERTERGDYAVFGRDLHSFLEVKSQYRVWIKRMIGYGFTADQDYSIFFDRVPDSLGREHDATNHILTLDMAKELCMIQRSARGKQARQYFIEAEKQLRAVDTAPAHRLPNDYASALRELAEVVDTVEAQREQIALDAPKVAYHDRFIKDDDLLSLRTVARNNGIGERELRRLLIDRKWIYRETAQIYDRQNGWRDRYRYSEYQPHRHHFKRVMHHEVPKFRGEVMHSLKVTPSGASAISRLISRNALANQEVPLWAS